VHLVGSITLICLARDIHYCPIFLSCNLLASVYFEEHVCTYTYLTVVIVYELPLLPNDMILRVKRFYTNRERCHLDICRYGASPAVTGRIHNTGQNVYNLLFIPEVAATPVTSIFLSYRIPRGGLYLLEL
jgi:hypothetical protein